MNIYWIIGKLHVYPSAKTKKKYDTTTRKNCRPLLSFIYSD